MDVMVNATVNGMKWRFHALERYGRHAMEINARACAHTRAPTCRQAHLLAFMAFIAFYACFFANRYACTTTFMAFTRGRA